MQNVLKLLIFGCDKKIESYNLLEIIFFFLIFPMRLFYTTANNYIVI